MNEFLQNWLMFLFLVVAIFTLIFKFYFLADHIFLAFLPCQQYLFHNLFIGLLSGSPHYQVFLLEHSSGWMLSLSIIIHWILPSRQCILLCNIKFYSILANFTLKLSHLFIQEDTKLNTTTSVPFLPFFLLKIIHMHFRRNHLLQTICLKCILNITHEHANTANLIFLKL